MTLFQAGARTATFPISTSKFGLGTEEESNRTPLGAFQIKEKIGGDHPIRTIFKSRIPEGQWSPEEETEEDLVLSRILWLDGLDPENANTHDRYIYIHGTSDEARIGEPVSAGCIRMRNNDVIELFDEVLVDDLVLIR